MLVFGLGRSGAMAGEMALQLGRIGLGTRATTHSGIRWADLLLAMRSGDVLVPFACAPLYREVRVVVDRAEALGLAILLISDGLGPLLERRVAVTLNVPRGRSGHLVLHSATMVMIEALVLGLSALDRGQALDALDDFAGLRAAIDCGWSMRDAAAQGLRTPHCSRTAGLCR